MILNVTVITVRKRSLGQGNIFAPVCHSVHGGSTWAGTPPGRYSPLPPAGTPPGRCTPRAGTPPWAGTPPAPWAGTSPQAGNPPAMHAGIWSTSGRYASYWNAFLFHFFICLRRIKYTYTDDVGAPF